jgi:hypothetical protein
LIVSLLNNLRAFAVYNSGSIPERTQLTAIVFSHFTYNMFFRGSDAQRHGWNPEEGIEAHPE